MTSEHYLREISELLKEMNQRLAKIEREFVDPLLRVERDGTIKPTNLLRPRT
jgi:hypothetical protein